LTATCKNKLQFMGSKGSTVSIFNDVL